MSSNLKVNTILPSVGSNIGIGTNGGELNVDGGCKVQVGTALTLGHSIGLQYATQNLHSEGFEINQINASGIITASHFYGNGANLTSLPSQVTINNAAANRVLTSDGGTTINGEDNLTFDGTYLDLGDNKYVRLGASNDFQMWHNGGTGNTNIKQVTGDMYFYTGSDLNMHMRDGTSVDLYYANSKRLETTADGIKLYPDASGILIESGGDTNWTTGAMNVVRMGGNQADIRLGSNYGVKIGVSGNNDSNEFVFGQDNTNNGFIRNEASNKIEFQTTTSGTTRFRIDHNGNCTINDGDLVIGTAGHGIDFSATPNGYAGSINETLDDYEEGYFTPTVGGWSASGTGVYGSGGQNGRYTKIGNTVTIFFHVYWTALNNASGVFAIENLPFAHSSSTYNLSTAVQMRYVDYSGDTVFAIGGNGYSSSLLFYAQNDNGNHNYVPIDSNGGRIEGTVTYLTDS